MVGIGNEDALSTHPCYNEEAHKKFARMHLPVAPRCNIQCNYCNRKYDCSNESRPGVTSEVLSPQEAADKVAVVLEKIPELKVIGIAGPGDPLANEETFDTIGLIRDRFPELTLCISTNGLMLPQNAQRLYDLGVRFVTVTMNAVDPSVSEKIYSSVNWDRQTLKGIPAAERLLENQLDGIEKCVDLGMVVKINTVLIPGINDDHIPELVKTVEGMGVYIINILPLIPVEGTAFSDRRAPTPAERKELTDRCSGNVKMMRHCRQCRADAIGLLGEDRSQEFVRNTSCGSKCGPVDVSENVGSDIVRIAVASDNGVNVNRGFGNTGMFMTFSYDGKFRRDSDIIVERSEPVYGDPHNAHIANIIDRLRMFDMIIVKEIGPRPMTELSAMGKKVIITKDNVDDALKAAVLEDDGA